MESGAERAASEDEALPDADRKTVKAGEVLVLDSSTFIKEIGLMSEKGSALKHYLYCRGMQLVVPEAAAEEYERNLAKVAKEKIVRIHNELGWLAQFCGGVGGWRAPGDDVIEGRAKALAAADGLGAILLPESTDTRGARGSGTGPNGRQATRSPAWGTAESGNSAWSCCRAMTSFSLPPTRIFAATAHSESCTRCYVPKRKRREPVEA